MKKNEFTPIEPGLRLGVGKGFFHVKEVNDGMALVEGKKHIDAENGFEVLMPVKWVSQLAKIEQLEKKAESYRKGKDYFEKERDEANARVTRLEREKDKAIQEASEKNQMFIIVNAKKTELQEMVAQTTSELVDSKFWLKIYASAAIISFLLNTFFFLIRD